MLYNGRGGTTYSCLKLPFYADPDPCLIHSSFCPTCPQSKRHFDRLSRFSIVHGRETTESELSVGWVDPRVGSGRDFKGFLVGCVGGRKMCLRCLLCARMYVCCIRMEFDWGVVWVGLWVQRFHFSMGGLGWVSGLVGSVGLKKVDPRTTLRGISVVMGRIYAMQQ